MIIKQAQSVALLRNSQFLLLTRMDPNSAMYDDYMAYRKEFFQKENGQKSVGSLNHLSNTTNLTSFSNNNPQIPCLFPESVASTPRHKIENIVSGIPTIRRVHSGDSDDFDQEVQSRDQSYHLQPKQQPSLQPQPTFTMVSAPSHQGINCPPYQVSQVSSRVTSPLSSQSSLTRENSRNSNMMVLPNNTCGLIPVSGGLIPKNMSQQITPVPMNQNHRMQVQVPVPPMVQQTSQDFKFATIYSVQFKSRKMRYCMGKLCKDQIAKGDFVIVGVHGLRGLDCGVVCDIIPPNDEKIRKAATEKDWAPSYNKNNILRKARHAEVLSLTQKTHDEQKVVEFARNVAFNYHYNIQIVDAEFQFDRKKVEIYYLLPPNETEKPGNFEDFVYEIAVTLECHVVLDTYKGGNK